LNPGESLATTLESLMTDERIECAACDYTSHSLLDHVVEVHGMTPTEYVAAYPGAETLSKKVRAAFEAKTKSIHRRPVSAATDLTVKLMGMEVPVDAHVSADDCLPLPEGYMFPTKGKSQRICKRAVMALVRGRNVFIWGMPGTGKDALVHAVSFFMRRSTVMLSFKPGTDVAPWFYTRSIGKDGTGWDYGHVWDALVNGIMGRDGKRRAPLLLLSDVDRADEAQAEWFRVLTDSISGRILGPDGKMVTLFVDEWGNKPQFVCTANTCGTGDARGRMASSNPMDASILDRLGRKIEATYLHWDDEGMILRGKFPQVAEMAPSIFDELGNATAAVRQAIEKESIYAELTHRGLCEILAEAEDILHFAGRVPANLLKSAFLAWTDGLDADNRFEAKRLIDAHVTGGALDSADAPAY
jgi:MoxR-like ATPase